LINNTFVLLGALKTKVKMMTLYIVLEPSPQVNVKMCLKNQSLATHRCGPSRLFVPSFILYLFIVQNLLIFTWL